MEVFSFGDGARYKLGHNNTTGVSIPQAIADLSGVGICKLASGNLFSLALSNTGKHRCAIVKEICHSKL